MHVSLLGGCPALPIQQFGDWFRLTGCSLSGTLLWVEQIMGRLHCSCRTAHTIVFFCFSEVLCVCVCVCAGCSSDFLTFLAGGLCVSSLFCTFALLVAAFVRSFSILSLCFVLCFCFLGDFCCGLFCVLILVCPVVCAFLALLFVLCTCLFVFCFVFFGYSSCGLHWRQPT